MYGRDSHTNLIRPEGSVAGKEAYPVRVPLVAGRDFTERDNLLSPPVIALLAVGVLACCIPARRAMRVDPLHALRTEGFVQKGIVDHARVRCGCLC